MDGNKRADIKPGLNVAIVLKQDQRSGKLTEGVVKDILTGVNTAYIAIAYPILLPLIQHLPNFVNLSVYIYVIGFSGILLSPVHLCLVFTNEYFKSNLLKVYKYLFPPVFLLMILSTLLAIFT